jgi:minimal PKS acyl carrier protein
MKWENAMSRNFSLEDLRRVLFAAAGPPEGIEFDSRVLDTALEQLGYESLARLEIARRIEREYAIALEDAAVMDAETPRAVLDVVNVALARTAA